MGLVSNWQGLVSLEGETLVPLTATKWEWKPSVTRSHLSQERASLDFCADDLQSKIPHQLNKTDSQAKFCLQAARALFVPLSILKQHPRRKDLGN